MLRKNFIILFSFVSLFSFSQFNLLNADSPDEVGKKTEQQELLDFNNPDFAAYSVSGRSYNRLPLEIYDHQSVVDIHSGVQSSTQVKDLNQQSDYISEIKNLDLQLNQVLDPQVQLGEAYKKNKADDIDSDSDFWTMV